LQVAKGRYQIQFVSDVEELLNETNGDIAIPPGILENMGRSLPSKST
jgi:hypothetical protein